mmetsp:Transcript_78506/g.139210  ORF Transcript_78506/g.139210 Transcript_78506/m.139210 type:complete len:861 (+) Transcript_78506:91-2673(+)
MATVGFLPDELAVEEAQAGFGELRLGTDATTLASLDLNSILGTLPGAPIHARAGGGRGPGGASGAQQLMSAHQQSRAAAAPQLMTMKASAQHSLAHGPALGGGRCGERMQFTITAIAEDGQVCRGSGTRVMATVSGVSLVSKAFPEPRPWVEDRKDGTFVVQFVCATPGKYDVNAYVDGMPLPMCPVTIQVHSGLASPMHSEMYGEGTKRCELGGRQEFMIQARDEFGNACDTGGARFGVRAVGHAKLHEVADNEDGTYAVVYSVPEYAKGPIRLEVLLDGVPLKNSPITPAVSAGQTEQKESEAVFFGPGLSGQLDRLRWLRQNPPAEVPLLPPPPVGSGALSTQADAAKYSSAQAQGDSAAARLAWRAADEWRRLGELRAEMAKCRENLVQHQAVLLSVGDAVHREYAQLEEKRRGLEADKQDITEVETRLDWFRADLTRQYKQQQRWVSAGLSSEAGGGKSGLDTGIGGGLDDSGFLGSLSPARGGDAGGFGRYAGGFDDIGGGADEEKPGATREANQLQQLQEEVDKRRRWLRELEEAGAADEGQNQPPGRRDARTPRGGGGPRGRNQGDIDGEPLPPPAPPPLVPPLVAQPPPESVSEMPWRGGQQRGPITTPPPPNPPPRLDDDLLGRTLDEPAGEISPSSRSPSPHARQRQGVLRTPPPPPSPPPPVVMSSGFGTLPEGAQGTRGRSPMAGAGYPGPAAGTPRGGDGSARQGASPEELGQAMRKLFNGFANRATGPVQAPRGGRGRVALGLADFVRLANAAQLRMPQNELMAAFYATLSQYSGGPMAASGEDQSLPFELFVELLVETARRKYPDFSDTESTAALFEEHLLPLSRRLRELEGSGDPGRGGLRPY